jgi:hypothetical protein
LWLFPQHGAIQFINSGDEHDIAMVTQLQVAVVEVNADEGIGTQENTFMKHNILLLIILLLGWTFLLTACGTPEPPICPESPQADCPEADLPTCPECEACPELEACPETDSFLPEIEESWSISGHGNSDAEAFRHWDEADPAVVSLSCAKCHTTTGYVEFVTTGEVTTESPAVDDKGIQCVACHNDPVSKIDSVVMPSGTILTGLGDESRCMVCHQGRESKFSIDGRIAEAAGLESAAEADPDIAYDGLGFVNIHYYAAAATKYGTVTLLT